MDNQEWVRLGGTLVGGGAMGALITAAIGAHRNRIQPVGYRIVSNRILSPEFSKTSLSCKLMMYSGDRKTTFDNILMSQVLIVNKGNRDTTCFRFGLTMNAAFRAIHIEASTSDRHHVMVEAGKPIDFVAPSAEIDVELKPFNRKDVYTLNLLIAAPEDASVEELSISVSSPEAVRFVKIPTVGETAALTAVEGFRPHNRRISRSPLISRHPVRPGGCAGLGRT